MNTYPVSDELNDIAVQAVEAVGGGVLAVDLVRTSDQWQVIDLSQPTGLAEAEEVTGINIAEHIIEYAVSYVKTGAKREDTPS